VELFTPLERVLEHPTAVGTDGDEGASRSQAHRAVVIVESLLESFSRGCGNRAKLGQRLHDQETPNTVDLLKTTNENSDRRPAKSRECTCDAKALQ
jgi:hypothetical protein